MNKQTLNIIKIGAAAVATFVVVGIIYNATKKGKKIKLTSSSDSDSDINVLFIGDSSTAGSNSYADKIGQINPTVKVTKIAKVGASTKYMLDQLKSELAKGKKYQLISVLGGYNDLYNSQNRTNINDITANIDLMIDLAHKNGSKFLSISPPPSGYNKNANGMKKALQSDLSKAIMKNKADFKVDLHSLILEGDNKPILEYVGSDKEHLNNSGHLLLAQEITKKVFK